MARGSAIVVGVGLFSAAVSGCGGKSPSAPSAPGQAQAAVVAETVGSVTMAALFAGAQQAGVSLKAGVSRLGFVGTGPHAGAGQMYGTASCPSGGRVDLVYVRDYVVAGGVVDTSAIKAVYAQCSLASGGTSVQMNGELVMSGMYQGASQPADLRLSGKLNTSAGECAVEGNVAGSGTFNGTACGIPQQATPQPRSAAALAAVGNYSLKVLDGSALPRVVVTSPCIGYMDTGGLSLKSDGKYEITMFGSFVCLNGPGPNVSYAEQGSWGLLGNDTIVLSAFGRLLFAASAATVSGSSVSMDLDVPSSAPNIPPTRMAATFAR
jgi:hypothetical protein